MTELTEAEKLAMQRALNGSTSGSVCGMLLTRAVEQIIDARLAPIRALADEWADADGETVSMDGLTTLTVTNRLGRTLRAALSAHESAPQAGDGAGSLPEVNATGEGGFCPNCNPEETQ